MKSIESNGEVPVPCGLVLIYPALSFDLACWMPPKQLNLIRAESVKCLPTLYATKAEYIETSPLAVSDAPKRINVLKNEVDRSLS